MMYKVTPNMQKLIIIDWPCGSVLYRPWPQPQRSLSCRKATLRIKMLLFFNNQHVRVSAYYAVYKNSEN